MKLLRNFSRTFVGIVFIYSGFVKVVDPLGTAYKFGDYFIAMHLEFLNSLSLTMSILLSVAELLIGIVLLFNLLPKISSWAVLLFMGLFTPLTLWLAVANPVADCGCFGDALILTNWQTFFKNIIILVFVIIIFMQRKKFKPLYNQLWQWSLSVIMGVATFGLTFYCLVNLPVIDFRPYHIGANIQEGMLIPDEEKHNVDIYESVFIYEKDGKKEEFLTENLPDSTWTFIDADHRLVTEGYHPPIHDFTIEPIYLLGISPEPADELYVNLYDAEFAFTKNGETEFYTIDMLPDGTWTFQEIVYEEELDPYLVKLIYLTPAGDEEYFTVYTRPDDGYVLLDAEYTLEQSFQSIPYGEDIADLILEDDNYFFFLIMTHVDNANTKNLDKINKIAAFCEQADIKFYCLTASNAEDIVKFITENDPVYEFYNTDPITLKTIVRSNPGLLLLKKGTIINKWSWKNIPDVNEMQSELLAKSVTQHNTEKENNLTVNYILALLLFMAGFHIFYTWMIKNKYITKN
ncbi:MAG: DoxX family protein [Bacteroidales bacterium]|nr:DoxX family protein [Bacteroidales bacterium]